MRTTIDGLVDIEFKKDESSKFTFQSEGKNFVIPGLKVDPTTGKLVA